ncbi:MAG: class II aldolase/adducin family protein [Candidatus Helarchaeota archaeon]|nr:class II aldolase/adducin family protein [Candidatus Helarchaeota archaeon]
MSSNLKKKKKLLLEVSRQMQKEGLVVGPGGNTSIKDEKGVMWISPSGIPFMEMTIDDFVPLDVATGKLIDSRLMPSSEVPLHLLIYQARPDVNCIIHAHPPYVISLSAVDIQIEPLFPDFVVYLGDFVPQIPYVTPCTEEMGQLVAQHIKKTPSCVLNNHGAVTVGTSIKEAYTRMQVLEAGAQILFQAKLLGKPRVLTKVEARAILNLDIEQYRKKLLRESDK